MSELNQKVMGVCNIDFVDKSSFDPIFFENISSVLQIIFTLLRNDIRRARSAEERNTLLNTNRELLIFAMHLNNALRIRDTFKFNANRPVDFFKYYQEIETESPERWASVLGILWVNLPSHIIIMEITLRTDANPLLLTFP